MNLIECTASLDQSNPGLPEPVAGLDMVEGEQYISEVQAMLRAEQPPEVLREVLQDHILFRRENVVFTPHNAFTRREALLRILNKTVENIRCLLQGAPVNLAG